MTARTRMRAGAAALVALAAAVVWTLRGAPAPDPVPPPPPVDVAELPAGPPAAAAEEPERSATIRGRVLLAGGDGSPAAGAQIVAEDEEEEGEDGAAVAAGDGSFSVAVPPGRYRVVATLPGRAPAAVLLSVREGELATVTLALHPAQRLAVRVADDGGRPLPGAEVVVWPEPGGGGASESVAAADDSGEAAFEELPPGAVEVRASLAGYAPAQALVRLPTAGPLALVLPREAVLELRIGGERGEPLAEAKVALAVPGQPPQQEQAAGEDGTVRFGELPHGRYELVAGAPGHLAQVRDVEVREPGVTRVDLRLAAAAAIEGTVEPPGGLEPRGIAVEAFADAALTVRASAGFADGASFALDGLSPGTYHVRASMPGAGRVVRELRAPSKGAVLRLQPGATVRARVRGPDGAPVEAIVAGQAVAQDGVVELAGLEPGRHRLSFEAGGFAPRTVEVELGAGEVRDLGDVVLDAGGSIAGTVLGPGGRGVPARIHVAPVGGGPGETGDGETEPDGSFVVPNLPPRAYDVVAIADGLAPAAARVVVASGTARVELRLGAGARLSGRVWAEPAVPASRSDVAVRTPGYGPRIVEQALTDPEGRFEVGPLPPGRYVVAARVAGTTLVSTVELRAAGAAVVLGPPRGGTTISGRVRLRGGQPVAGASLALVAGTVPAPTDAEGIAAIEEAPDVRVAGSRPVDAQFRFEDVEPGPHTILVGIDGPGPRQVRAVAVPVDVPAAGERAVDIVVPEGLVPIELPGPG